MFKKITWSLSWNFSVGPNCISPI